MRSVLTLLLSFLAVFSSLSLHNYLNGYELFAENILTPLLVTVIFAFLVERNFRLMERTREKRRLLVEFVNIAVHDIRNPIAVIHALMDLLKLKLKDPPQKIKEYIERADLMTSELLRITQELSESAMLTDDTMKIKTEPVPLQPVIKRLVEFFKYLAERKRITLEYDLSQFKTTIIANEKSLFDALSHLVSNAIKYSPAESKVQISFQQENEVARIIVEDEGPGIKTAEKHLLFEKYSKLSARPTTGEMSTGLGLYLFKNLTVGMGGTFGFHSEGEGTGSQFWAQFKTAP